MITEIKFNEKDGKVYGKLFGEIDIYGIDLLDLKIAAREAFECFCIAAEMHGDGLKSELQKMLN